MHVDVKELKIIMVKNGFNQTQLAYKAGISRSTLYWLFRRSKSNLSTISHITKALNIEPSAIIKE